MGLDVKSFAISEVNSGWRPPPVARIEWRGVLLVVPGVTQAPQIPPCFASMCTPLLEWKQHVVKTGIWDCGRMQRRVEQRGEIDRRRDWRTHQTLSGDSIVSEIVARIAKLKLHIKSARTKNPEVTSRLLSGLQVLRRKQFDVDQTGMPHRLMKVWIHKNAA